MTDLSLSYRCPYCVDIGWGIKDDKLLDFASCPHGKEGALNMAGKPLGWPRVEKGQ